MEQPKRVIVVGVGGIGSWLVPPLCRLLAYKKYAGEVWLCDGDKFEPHNADRQDVGEGLGMNKAEAMCDRIFHDLPNLRQRCLPEFLTEGNVAGLIAEDSIVLIAVDNHPARALIAGHAQTLRNVVVLTAGNELYDGNVHVYRRGGGKDKTGPLSDRHPEAFNSNEGNRAAMSCEQLAQEGEPQLLVTNFMAATALLCAFWGVMEAEVLKRRKISPAQEIYFDIRRAAMIMVPAPGRGA